VEKGLGLVDRRAEESVDETLEWLAGAKTRPFFLWLHLFDPHSAYDPPEPFHSRYGRNLYDGEIAYTDSQLARLFDWLKKNRLYDQSIIVFTSDHGESLGEHGEDEHGFFVYNSTLHVPLIIKPHRGSPLKRRQIGPPVEIISIGPTILQLAAIQDPIQSQFQARSLVALMTHGQAPEDRVAYGETFYPFSSFGWSPLRSLQTARYHYIEAPEPELYDLRQDPGETNNLAAQQPERAAALRAQLHELIARYPAPQHREAMKGLTLEESEKLRSLGYVAFRAPGSESFDPAGLGDPKSKLREFNSILRAMNAFAVDDYTTGRSLLKKIQEADPELYIVHFLLGEAASTQREWGTAADEFEKALNLNPSFDQAMLGLGRALNMIGKPLEAQKWLRRTLAINDKNFRAWFELARVQAGKDTAAAIRSLGQALTIQPNFAPAHRQRGILEIGRENYATAVTHLERAVQLGMTEPATLNYLGIAYSRTGQLDRAVASYQRALAEEADFAEAHLNLGFAYQRLNQAGAARKEYETACRLDKKLCQYVPELEK
jgi:Tfp pilus assembly protein PilF